MENHKEQEDERRGRSFMRRNKKKKTFENYGWMKRISPTRKNTGNSASKNRDYGAPGNLLTRIEKTEESKYTIRYGVPLEKDTTRPLEVDPLSEFAEEPPKIPLDH